MEARLAIECKGNSGRRWIDTLHGRSLTVWGILGASDTLIIIKCWHHCNGGHDKHAYTYFKHLTKNRGCQ